MEKQKMNLDREYNELINSLRSINSNEKNKKNNAITKEILNDL